MERNRFRVPSNGAHAPRAATAHPPDRLWGFQRNRESFSARERSNPPMHSNTFEGTPAFPNDGQPLLVGEEGKSDSRQLRSAEMTSSSDSSSHADNIEKEDSGSLFTSKLDAVCGPEEGMLDEALSTEYGNNEIGEHLKTSFAEVDDILEGLWDLSRAPIQLQQHCLSIKQMAQKQNVALLKEQDTSARLSMKLDALQRNNDEITISKQESENRILELEELLKTATSNCEGLHDQIKKLKDEACSERICREEAYTTLEVQLEHAATNLKHHEKSLLEKDKVIREVKEELTYVELRIEDEIATRAKIVDERDKSLLQLSELEKSLESERSLRNAADAKRNKEIDSLRRKDSCQVEKIEELTKSFNFSTKQNLWLQGELKRVEVVLGSIENAQQEFLQAVTIYRDSQDYLDIQAFGLADGFLPTDNEAGNEGEVAENDLGTHPVVASRMASAGRRISSILLEAAIREIVLVERFATNKESFNRFQDVQVDVKGSLHTVRVAVQHVTQELSGAKEQLGNLSRSVHRIQDERDKSRLLMLQEVDILKNQRDTAKNDLDACKKELSACKNDFDACQNNFNACTSDIKKWKGKLGETQRQLQKAYSEHEAGTKTFREKLHASNEEKAKLLRDLDLVRKSLTDCQDELRSSSKSAESAMKATQDKLKTESLSKQGVLSELEKYREQLRMANEELDCATKMAHSARESTESQLEALGRQLSDAVKEKEDLQKRLETANTERVLAVIKLEECEGRAGEEQRGSPTTQPYTHHERMETMQRAQAQKQQNSGLRQFEGHDPAMAIMVHRKNHNATNDAADIKEQSNPHELNDQTVLELKSCVETAVVKQKKRQPGTSLQKASKSKRSKLRPPRAAPGKEGRGGTEAGKFLRKPKGHGGRSSQQDSVDDDDWVVESTIVLPRCH